ncbi:hypothetical protein ACYAFX_23840 [Rhodococcus aetherivorans]
MIPPDVGDVVRRWNPEGWARLHATSDPPRIRVAGVDGCGRGALVDELTALGPAVDYVHDGPATVVLMVFEASAHLGRTELAVLESAGRGSGRVVCALTGTDAHPDWRAVHERDVALLQRHAPWLGPVTLLPVGTSLAARARAVGGDAGAVLRLESGIVDLHEALTAALVAGPHAGRALRTAVVAETRHLVVQAIAALRAGDDTGPCAPNGRGGACGPPLPPTTEGSAPSCNGPASTPRRPSRRPCARRPPNYATRSRRWTRRTCRTCSTTWSATCTPGSARSSPSGWPGSDRVTRSRPDPVPPRPAPPSPRRPVEDRLTVLIGASAGAGLGRVAVSPLSLVPTLELATVPLSLLLGAAAAWWLVRVRRRLAERDRMRRWALEELVEVRAELEAVALERIVDAEARLGSALAVARTARLATARDRIAALDDELRRRAEDRAGQLAACERDFAVLARAGTAGRPGASNGTTASDGVTRQ